MKGNQKEIGSIIKSKKSLLKAIILYGPNTFFVDALYKKLCRALVDEEKEIFGSREFDAKEITGNSEGFYNETQSITFGLEKKYIKINMFGSVTQFAQVIGEQSTCIFKMWPLWLKVQKHFLNVF